MKAVSLLKPVDEVEEEKREVSWVYWFYAFDWQLAMMSGVMAALALEAGFIETHWRQLASIQNNENLLEAWVKGYV